MNAIELLTQLSARLRLIQQRQAEEEEARYQGGEEYGLVATGRLSQMRNEVEFLTDLIDQIEREGVTP